MSKQIHNTANGTQPSVASGQSKHGGMAQSIHSQPVQTAKHNHQSANKSTSGSIPGTANYNRQVTYPSANGSGRRNFNQSHKSTNYFARGPVRGTANHNSQSANFCASSPAQGNSKNSRGRWARNNHGTRNNYCYKNNQTYGSKTCGPTSGTANNPDNGIVRSHEPANCSVNAPVDTHDDISVTDHDGIPQSEQSQVPKYTSSNNPMAIDQGISDRFLTQAEATHKVEPWGSFFELEKDFRDELWDEMKLKIPKFSGYDSWAIPFPADLDFSKLAVGGCNYTYKYLDERFVRPLFRTHKDKDGKAVSYSLLLSPCNPSIELDDLQFRAALMDAWYKLNQWLAKLIQGDEVTLVSFLKGELEREVKEKLERTL